MRDSIDQFKDILPFGAGNFPEFLANLEREAPAICSDFAERLRALAKDTVDRKAPPSLREPFVPAIVPPSPKLTRVFALRNLVWAGGGHASAYEFGELPPRYADEAIRRGAACSPDDPRVKNLWGKGISQDPFKVVDLDVPADRVTVLNASSGRVIGYETPLEAFKNYRAGEEPKQVFVARGPDPEPGGPDEQF